MQTCDPQSTNTHLIDLIFLPSLLHFIKADIFFSFLSCSTSIIHMRCLIMYLAHLITDLVVRLISIWRTMNIKKDIEYQNCGALGTRAPLTTTMDMLISSTLLEGHQTGIAVFGHSVTFVVRAQFLIDYKSPSLC
ncbi:hypothetical protein BDV30DRAFT_218033 [Aspergillus minisclerotigenes]|uniref:Uncharacterized protein n=1 Tax=Aspergillus minisclerotigenes TaxID=656917 RepID=A0A5N6ITU5_9EURO|nr:hypothetical protein BDV30DRAFT_218033 [Aspergillus minisclerotigenes]